MLSSLREQLCSRHPVSHLLCYVPYDELLTDQLKLMLGQAQQKYYGRRTTILRQGKEANGLFILYSGLVRLFHITPCGKVVILDIIGPGRIIGLTEMLAGKAYNLSAEALEECELGYLKRELFEAVITENPILAINLLRLVSYDAQRLLAKLCYSRENSTSAERLLHVLQELAMVCGSPTTDGVKIELPLVVQELADGIGCSRQWTSKILNDMVRQGLIQRKGGWIFITPSGLL